MLVGLNGSNLAELSLSARRVWIEIPDISPKHAMFSSLSARRVWIEIINDQSDALKDAVTLREEGVD